MVRSTSRARLAMHAFSRLKEWGATCSSWQREGGIGQRAEERTWPRERVAHLRRVRPKPRLPLGWRV